MPKQLFIPVLVNSIDIYSPLLHKYPTPFTSTSVNNCSISIYHAIYLFSYLDKNVFRRLHLLLGSKGGDELNHSPPHTYH